MPTNTEIKTQIDLDITNKIVAKSVKPIHVGSNMKTTIDYTDQEIATTIEYIDDELLNIPQAPLEYSAQLYQNGTDNISPQFPQIDTITQGNLGEVDYREIVFSRTGVGTFYVQIQYETSGFVDTNKCALLFGDSVVRITGSSNGTDGSSFYKRWTFQTHDLTGTVADSQLQGNNGTFMNIKIYN